MKKAKGEVTSRCPALPAADATTGKDVMTLGASVDQATEHAVAASLEGVLASCEVAVAPAPAALARGAGAPEPLVEQSVWLVPVRQLAQLGPETLEAASPTLGRLHVDLQDGDGRLMEGRLGLICGWLLANESARTS